MSALAGRPNASDHDLARFATPRGGSSAARRRTACTRARSSAGPTSAGEVDLATAPALKREALRVFHDAHGRLILDLSATTFMDLSGARVVNRLARTASALGGQLAIVAVTYGVRLVLELVPPHRALVTDA